MSTKTIKLLIWLTLMLGSLNISWAQQWTGQQWTIDHDYGTVTISPDRMEYQLWDGSSYSIDEIVVGMITAQDGAVQTTERGSLSSSSRLEFQSAIFTAAFGIPIDVHVPSVRVNVELKGPLDPDTLYALYFRVNLSNPDTGEHVSVQISPLLLTDDGMNAYAAGAMLDPVEEGTGGDCSWACSIIPSCCPHH